ncbi:MAG: aldo/keto reductase [Desulfovibrionaceae bacterium]|nr:aldo/keto reductase [Desulfovibrionaceae bacterium]
MDKRKLGNLEVTSIGMGCMALSHGYGQIPTEEYSIDAIHTALDYGCTFFDTAEVYSPNLEGLGHNELIVGKALHSHYKDIKIATKLFIKTAEIQTYGSVDQCIRKHLEASFQRLQTTHVDLYYLHRINPDIHIEDIASAMGKLIQEGLISGWGLSAVSADTIAKAHKVTPLTAVQNIYNMLERSCDKDVFPYCLKHNIGVVPFSPVGSGFLSGNIDAQTQFEKQDDVRNWVPQLSKENIIANQPIVDILTRFANEKNATKAQIAIAWILHKHQNAVPIPGSKNKQRIVENLSAWQVHFTPQEFQDLETALNNCKVYGHRGHVEEGQNPKEVIAKIEAEQKNKS